MQLSRRQFLNLGLSSGVALGCSPWSAVAGGRLVPEPALALSVWDVNAVRPTMPQGRGGAKCVLREQHSTLVQGNNRDPLGLLTPESEEQTLRIIAAGEPAQRAVHNLQCGQTAADLRFTNITNVSLQPRCDIAIFVGDAASVSRLNPVAGDTAFWPIALVLDAANAADFGSRGLPAFNYGRLFFVGTSAEPGQAVDILDMLVSLGCRHGFIGTDLADIRRILRRQGECHFHCHRGSGLGNIRQSVDAVIDQAKLDARVTDFLAVLAGPPTVTLNDFMYLNEQLADVSAHAEGLVTVKTLEGVSNDQFAVALWTFT